MEVIYKLYSEWELNEDRYRFGDEEQAREKFLSLCEIIKEQIAVTPEGETINEPLFFGISDPARQCWATVQLIP